MPPRDIVLALLAVSTLGLSFVATKVGLADVPPLLLTTLRFVFAAVPAVFFLRRPPALGPVMGFGLAFGVTQFGLLFSAIHLGMPAGLASLVIQAQVFFTMLLAFAVFGERPNRHQMLGALVAAGGIAIIAILPGGGAPAVPLAMVLAAALGWSVSNIIAKRAGRVDHLAFVAWACLLAIAPMLAFSLALEGPAAIVRALAPPSGRAILAVAYLAYPTTLLAFSIWTGLLGRHAAASVMPFGFLVPVVGLASTHVLLGEPFGPVRAVGGALVLLGLALNILGSRAKSASTALPLAKPGD